MTRHGSTLAPRLARCAPFQAPAIGPTLPLPSKSTRATATTRRPRTATRGPRLWRDQRREVATVHSNPCVGDDCAGLDRQPRHVVFERRHVDQQQPLDAGALVRCRPPGRPSCGRRDCVVPRSCTTPRARASCSLRRSRRRQGRGRCRSSRRRCRRTGSRALAPSGDPGGECRSGRPPARSRPAEGRGSRCPAVRATPNGGAHGTCSSAAPVSMPRTASGPGPRRSSGSRGRGRGGRRARPRGRDGSGSEGCRAAARRRAAPDSRPACRRRCRRRSGSHYRRRGAALTPCGVRWPGTSRRLRGRSACRASRAHYVAARGR